LRFKYTKIFRLFAQQRTGSKVKLIEKQKSDLKLIRLLLVPERLC
jgi:hypothetical protein